MKKAARLSIIAIAALALWATDANAYDRYDDGGGGNCVTCHGAFDGPISTKGSVFPSDSKHEMHRASSSMNTNCNLCHTSIGDNPLIGSSKGTNDNVGYGCVGCHGRLEDAGNDGLSAGIGAGLRQHHNQAGVTVCSACHSDANPANYTPVGEDILPPYYGTADTNADDPCNEPPGLLENWTLNGTQGSDNDGDGLYDLDDTDDCAVPSATPTSSPTSSPTAIPTPTATATPTATPTATATNVPTATPTSTPTPTSTATPTPTPTATPTPTPTPEPSAQVLSMAALATLYAIRRSRRRS